MILIVVGLGTAGTGGGREGWGEGRGGGRGKGGAGEKGGEREKCVFFLELLHVLISFQLVLIMFHRIFSGVCSSFF